MSRSSSPIPRCATGHYPCIRLLLVLTRLVATQGDIAYLLADIGGVDEAEIKEIYEAISSVSLPFDSFP